MLLGVHVSGAAKIYDTLEVAHGLGCNTMQIFSRSPQRWRSHKLAASDIIAFKENKARFEIKPVFIHVPYLINLASPEAKLYGASIRAYIEDILEAEALGADYIVTHMGSHKETNESAGLKRFSSALNRIIKKTVGSPVGILLENTSGAGSWLGYTFKHHKKILDGLDDKSRVGLCIDTAHAYAAGYDIASKSGLDALLNEVDKNAGLKRLKLIHLNDTSEKLGSRHDRHQHIGEGNIGLAGMKNIVNHVKLKDTAFILETPKDTAQADSINLNTVRKLRMD